MSPTNIHTPTALLNRATYGGTFTDQATIQPSNRPILVVSGSATQDDVNQYRWCLKSHFIGQWVSLDESTGEAKPCTPDDPLNHPQARITKGLSLSPANDVRYALIIQGRSGSAKAKVITETSPERAAVAIFAEALNGYSTVLSVAYHLNIAGNSSIADSRSTTFIKTDALDNVQTNPTVVSLLC